jgi:hypothetical protein
MTKSTATPRKGLPTNIKCTRAGMHRPGPFSNGRSHSRETFLRFIHLKARQADKFSRSEKCPTSLGLWVSESIPAVGRGKSSTHKPLTTQALCDIKTPASSLRPQMPSRRARRLQHSAGCRQAMTRSPPTCPHVIHNCVDPGTRRRRTRPSAVSKLSGGRLQISDSDWPRRADSQSATPNPPACGVSGKCGGRPIIAGPFVLRTGICSQSGPRRPDSA